MSSYRDDLEAAQARAGAAEDEARRLREEVDRLKAPPADGVAIPIPERFTVSHADNDLMVSWRWFRAVHVVLLFFVVTWDGFLVFWYFGSLASEAGVFFQLFPIVHVAVGLGLTYIVLAGFANRTTIRAQAGTLRVHHGPLPWRGNRTIASATITQLYVAEVVREHTDNDTNRVTITRTYDLCAMLDDRREVRLVRGLESAAQGQYLESAFERQLAIVDRAVAGEVRKP